MDARRGLAVVLLLTGCASAPEAVAPAPKASPQERAPAAEAAPQKALPVTPSQEVPPSRDDSVVVVDPGEEEAPVGLVEASRAEKERRAKAAPSKIVINDKNLPQYAKKGQITVADPKEKEKKAKQAAAAQAAAAGPVRDEPYWRSRGREIRVRWSEAAEEIKELEKSAAGLRQRFYAEDDPYARDSQIKPEWDRSLDRLRKAREEAETAKKELAAFLDEGRVAGALPGWLREGIEFEPEEEKPKEEFPPHESIEPPILGDDGGGR